MTVSFISVTPANGSTYSVSRPAVVFQFNSDENNVKVTLEYWISTSGTPMTDPMAMSNSVEYDLVSTGFAQNQFVALDLPSRFTLTPGVWNMTARMKYTVSGTVIGTKNQSFTAAFVPNATPLTPYSNESRPFVNTTSNLLLTWKFAGEALNDDVQTAYQVVVNRVSDGQLVADSGKTSGSIGQAVVTIPAGYADVDLSWKVRVWNKWDTPSTYSTSTIFRLGATFAMSISSPTNNEVLAAGNPNLTVGVTISGGRTVKAINASAWKGDAKVWEKTVFGNWATGATVNITDTVSVFTNSSYTYKVTGQDNYGGYSSPTTRNFSVNFPLPPTPSGTPTVNTSGYSSAGYTAVSWNDSTRDTDFYCWAIERKDDLIDPNTDVVVSEGEFNEIGREFGVSASYAFEDYLAPSNYKVTYRIVQVALKYGTEVRSVASTATAGNVLVSDAYWLYAGINGDPASIALKLHNVTADSVTNETESSTTVLIGRGRYSERGTKLGVVGSLSCQLRDSGGTPARLKRIMLESFIDLFPIARLRTPFGDEYLVSLGNVGVERIAGTGRSEFVNLSIPYSEVVS